MSGYATHATVRRRRGEREGKGGRQEEAAARLRDGLGLCYLLALPE